MNGDARRESVTSQALKASGTVAIAAGAFALAGGKFETDKLKENVGDAKGNVKKWAKDNNILQGKGKKESVKELTEKLGEAKARRKKTFNNANVSITRANNQIEELPNIAQTASANKKKIAKATQNTLESGKLSKGSKVLKPKKPLPPAKNIKLKMK